MACPVHDPARGIDLAAAPSIPTALEPPRGSGSTPHTPPTPVLRASSSTTRAILTNRPLPTPTRRKELIDRLLTGRAELCKHAEDIEVHHVRKLSEINPAELANPPAWMRLMTRRRRKTLVVCRSCHATIHPGQPTPLVPP